MSEEKKQVEEKRYAILSKDSIKSFAEASGHSDLSDEVAGLLAEDVVYRLREATQMSCQFMRHAKRRRLSTEDFNKALRTSDVPPLFGYGSPEPMKFRQTREGELHFAEDLELNLTNIALFSSQVPTPPGQTSIKAHWLAVEGIQKGGTLPQGVAGKTNGKGAKLSDEMRLYYDNMTMAILGNDQELMKFALADLRTNAKIAPLLPYLVNFISNGVKTVSHDITQLTKLLHTVKAIFSNQSLYLEPRPYLNLLVDSVKYCLLEPLAASINPSNDHWALRDYAARLLVQITRSEIASHTIVQPWWCEAHACFRVWSLTPEGPDHLCSLDWHTSVNRLWQQNLKALKDVFSDHSKPFCSHYGAVMGLITFGTQAVQELLLPRLATYWPHLETVMEDASCAPIKSDAFKVYSAILLAAELLMRERSHQQLFGVPSSPEYDISGIETFSVPEKDDVKSESPSQVGGECPMQTDEKPKDFPTIDAGKTGTDAAVEATLKSPDFAQPPHKILANIYKEFSFYFGDALATRLPVHLVSDFYVSKTEEVIVSLSDDDTRKTGEELLQNFIVDDDRTSPTGEEEFDEKSERSSRSQSDESFSGDDRADLTVKASGKGIKLTIFKMPKNKPPTPEPEILPGAPGQPGKKRGISLGQSHRLLSAAFELPPSSCQVPSFVFNYAGCIQRSEPRRKPFTLYEEMNAYRVPYTHSYRLNLILQPYGRHKSLLKPKKSRISPHIHQADITNVL